MADFLRALLPVFFMTSFVASAGAESWSLSVSYKLTGKMGAASMYVKANGIAQLQDDGSGNFTGKGSLSVTEGVTGPNLVSKTSGSGLFTVTGRRDGANLLFSISGSEIPLQGTVTVMGKTEPCESSFDPSSCTAGEASIERKEGASSAHKIDVSGVQSGVKAISMFQLKGGQNIVKKDEPPDPKQAAPEDRWILELDATQDYTVSAAGGMKGSGHDTFKGQVEFVLPEENGPVGGEGPMTYKGRYKWTSPIATDSETNVECVLILDGKVEDDVLTFVPKAKMTRVDFKQTGVASAQASSDLGEGQTLFNTTEEVSIPVENEAEKVIDINDSRHGMNMTGKFTWRLKGKKIEKWRITIDDYRINYLLNEGMGAMDKRCGLKVHARREIDVVIENKKFKSGQGKSEFVSIKGHSNPPWAYDVSAATTTIIGTGSDIDAERVDQTEWAERFNPPKNKADAELKKEWEKIKKNKTPYIYPEKFSAGGNVSGKQLSLVLPSKSGYTVAIYSKLNVAAVKKHGFVVTKNKRIEMMGLEEVSLFNKFTVTLKDGWKHEDAPPSALERTCLSVKKIK